jgi:hypothetical protein
LLRGAYSSGSIVTVNPGAGLPLIQLGAAYCAPRGKKI